jgi:hypothetical protein
MIVEVTAQVVTREGGQIPTSIDEKLRIANAVFLRETILDSPRLSVL